MCFGARGGARYDPSAEDNQYVIDQSNLSDADFQKKYSTPQGTLLTDWRRQQQQGTYLGSDYSGAASGAE